MAEATSWRSFSCAGRFRVVAFLSPDALDNQNNKKAVQLVDRVLKKQKDFTCAKVGLSHCRLVHGSSIGIALHGTAACCHCVLSR